jgi:hypothetical protein
MHAAKPYTGIAPLDPSALPLQRSGVTIATGFDIGQWSHGELNKLPLGEALRARLRPFSAPLRGRTAAVCLYNHHGLSITKSEADEIDAAVPRKVLLEFVGAYDGERRQAGGRVAFADLPRDICTAMFSFAFQYGAKWGPEKKGEAAYAQAYWKHITAQDWTKAVAVLRSYSQHRHRRGHEAKLIESGVQQIKSRAPSPIRRG